MALKRFWAILKARNLEFFRDKSSLSWSIIFPVLLLAGFAVVFSDNDKDVYKVGVIDKPDNFSAFSDVRFINFVDYQDIDAAMTKLERHQLDLVIDHTNKKIWQNESSANSYIVQKMLSGAIDERWQSSFIDGRAIRYVDWVLPGILGMNMMFSCLFGVGYVIVRYRKNMVLKRLNATPVKAIEFLAAQITSRLWIVIAISGSVFAGCDFIFDFYMLGSFWNLLLVAVLGAMSLISLGLLLSSRSRSEELTGGLLNLVTWPMMILSGVWFSLEGSPEFIRQISYFLPLTHLVEGARAVMIEGADFVALSTHTIPLAVMTFVFLTIGALMFRWDGDGR
ncbi:ABC transporter permease [Psychrosphaera sp. B3R10]|nr:ABC transporter permease [Psychrosphaera sp. I2R16]MBU2990892.1 ABC transporter permease [Psychrosphaera sp. B3R10]